LRGMIKYFIPLCFRPNEYMCRDFAVYWCIQSTDAHSYSFGRAFTVSNYGRSAVTAKQAMDTRIIAIVPQAFPTLGDTKVCRSDLQHCVKRRATCFSTTGAMAIHNRAEWTRDFIFYCSA
jgi:hypothetical protein